MVSQKVCRDPAPLTSDSTVLLSAYFLNLRPSFQENDFEELAMLLYAYSLCVCLSAGSTELSFQEHLKMSLSDDCSFPKPILKSGDTGVLKMYLVSIPDRCVPDSQ
jgi:hypothetical protein